VEAPGPGEAEPVAPSTKSEKTASQTKPEQTASQTKAADSVNAGQDNNKKKSGPSVSRVKSGAHTVTKTLSAKRQLKKDKKLSGDKIKVIKQECKQADRQVVSVKEEPQEEEEEEEEKSRGVSRPAAKKNTKVGGKSVTKNRFQASGTRAQFSSIFC
jgi:hypothetical protein